ncbi:MAG: aminotransferase class I/II-fold pyridoxal phosphate-dependent enzyme [Thermoanaerobaculia bacterium]|nr:aminotransferase class I/II-fold pyridoxal phosphate-dependent enzyme [Thermoanaerobaculia bacterium]MCZ7650976.1 aminotransferase class I/II-fold pyridoxal phosphate-dependent enzyme [Thermoanaerobaculia bacterium]
MSARRVDGPVDLRSDTVTRPDAAMRRAMAGAVVGDDVYGEDPTVRRLEEEAAAAVGQEAALFVPSGIMGNQIALRLLAPPGSEVLCDERAHILLYEMGAMAALSGLQPRTLGSHDGLPPPAAWAAALVPRGGYRVPTGVLALENSHNMAGGVPYPRERIDPVLALARGAALPAHLDGARIFNAAAAVGTSAAELAAGFDTVMFCLSKGLGAPVGSLLCASRERIREARQLRRLFGGGMRQVGVLAAAGLVALREGPRRLPRDHEHARRLAAALAELPGAEIDPARVRTNILIFRVIDRRAAAGSDAAGPVLRRLARLGVLASPVDRERIRLVTHRDVGGAQIERAIAALQKVLGGRRR